MNHLSCRAKVRLSGQSGAAQRLHKLRDSGCCIPYPEAPLWSAGSRPSHFRIFGHWRTGEVFVEVEHAGGCRVGSFPSRLKDLSTGERLSGILWPDLAEAFALAVRLGRPARDG